MSKNYQSHLPCQACGTVSVDRTFHHIYTRGARKDLAEKHWNKISLCSAHHVETHKVGTAAFAKKYPMIKEWLIYNGWEFEEFCGKWINAKASKLVHDQ